ncbi:hypothetical protein PTNB29_07066 [Pyrenophora teres f. teres]|nr:hypothetical protein PTNB29_07066 [Pyrenophora teres f. teres]CAA9964911.1 hypothetical protein PTMSG1_08270 [Pyrenophora teres f. maculata]
MAFAPLPLLPWDKSSLLSSKQSSGSDKSIQRTADTTDTIPSFAKKPSLERIINGPIPREQNEKRQKVVVEGWIEGLPQDMRERILEESLRDEDLDVAKKRLRALSDDSDHVPKTEYLTLAALVEVAMLAGKEDVAKELAQHEMTELYLQLQEKGRDKYLGEYEFRKWQDKRLDLSQSLRIWKILKDIALGKVLQIDEEALERSVQEGCKLMEKRFIHGPERPHADKSIQELLQVLDQNYIAARKLDPESGRVMKVVEDTVPDTFLRPGVSEAQITELEKRLAQNPSPDAEDDKPMLPNGKNGNYLRITRRFSLFPYVYTSIRGIDNIQLGHFDCFAIGIGGDEGTVILIPPTSVKPAVEAFEAAYASANKENKRLYERGALDLYGGIDEVRKLEWLCIRWEHWNTDQETWGGFRAHLEYCVDVAVEERKAEEGKAEKRERERRLKEKVGQEDEKKGEKRKRDHSNNGKPNKTTKIDAEGD